MLTPLDRGEWVLDRLRSPDAAIVLAADGRQLRARLSTLDGVLVSFLTDPSGPRRILVTVPRVSPGTLIPLSAWAVVNAVVGSSGRLPDGFRRLELSPARGVLLATSARRLRDAFSTASLSFGVFRQDLAGLPTFRLRTDWSLVPITPPSRVTLPNLPRVVFYHFDQLAATKPNIRFDVVLADVHEADGRHTVQRLISLLEALRPPHAVIVGSEFHDDLREQLERSGGCLVVPIGRKELPPARQAEEVPPSFERIGTMLPERSTLDWRVVTDSPASTLDEIFAVLAQAEHALGRDRPDALQLAWVYLRSLSGLALSPQSFERFASANDPYFSLTRLRRRLNYLERGTLSPRARAELAPRWPALLAMFDAAYEQLQRNPKWNLLLEAVTEPGTGLRTLLFLNRAVRDAVARELLITYNWTPKDGNDIQLSTWAEAATLNLSQSDVLAFSPIGRRRLQLMWAAIGRSLKVIDYPHGCRAAYAAARDSLARVSERNRVAAENLRRYGAPATSMDVAISVAELRGAGLPPPGRGRARYEQSLIELLGAGPDDLAEVGDGAAAPGAEFPSSERGGIVILLRSGEELVVPVGRELTVVDPTAGTVEGRFADELEPGHRIALLPAGSAEDLFREALRRTAHLTGVDVRPIAHWRNAVGSLHEESRGAVPDMIRLLQSEGTERNPLTIRQWLQGTTLAPQSRDDIAIVLKVARDRHYAEWAGPVSTEFEKLRAFHRSLGRRLRIRFGRSRYEPPEDRVDMELDELLADVQLAEVAEIRRPQ